MAEELGERTEDPTQKRLSEARSRGQVARSQDFSSALLLIVAVTLLAVFAERFLTGVGVTVRRALEPDSLARGLTTGSVMEIINFNAGQVFRLMVPMLLLMALAAYIVHVVQVGWLLTAKPLQPRLDKLDPIKGFKRIFSLRSLVKGVVNIAKLALLASVTYIVIKSNMDEIVALPLLTVAGALVVSAHIALETAIWALAALLLLGIIDLVYQRWQHTKDLRMTKHEVKDERKSAEGDPQIKSKRFKVAREIMLQRLRSSVPQADVVVTNPTHYAVALKYDERSMKAPRVVAKGADYVAIRIRMIAAAHRVPIVERPPLARALYNQVEVGQEIPLEQYEAVAEVLAYVYRLEGRAAS